MFDEIPVLVSCWRKTYAAHMLYRNISSNVFHFKDFFWGGAYCLSKISQWRLTDKIKTEKGD